MKCFLTRINQKDIIPQNTVPPKKLPDTQKRIRQNPILDFVLTTKILYFCKTNFKKMLRKLVTLSLIITCNLSFSQIHETNEKPIKRSNISYSSAEIYWKGKVAVNMILSISGQGNPIFLSPRSSKIISIKPNVGYHLKIINGALEEFTFDQFISFQKGKNHLSIKIDLNNVITVFQETEATKIEREKFALEESIRKSKEKEQNNKYQQLYERGNLAYSNGNYSLAASSYQEAQKIKQSFDLHRKIQASMEEVNFERYLFSAEKLLQNRALAQAQDTLERAKKIKTTAQWTALSEEVSTRIKFKILLTEANTLLEAKNYGEAKALYEGEITTKSIRLGGEKSTEINEKLKICNKNLSKKAKWMNVEQSVREERFDYAISLLEELELSSPDCTITQMKKEVIELKEDRKRMNYDELIKRGDSLLQKQQYDAAVSALQKAQTLYPSEKTTEKLAIAAELKAKLKNKKELNAHVEQLISQSQKLTATENYGKARALLTEAQVVLPSDERASLELAKLPTSKLMKKATKNIETKDFKKAIKHLKKLIKLEKSFHQAYVLLGESYESNGDDKKAFKTYKLALQEKPDNQEALLRRAELSYRTNEYLNSIADLTLLLGYDAINLQVRRLRIKNYILLKKHELALADCNFIIKNSSSELIKEVCWYDISVLQFFLGNVDKSLTAVNKSLNLNNKNPLYFFQKGIVLVSTDEVFKGAEALKASDKLITSNALIGMKSGVTGLITLDGFELFEKTQPSNINSEEAALAALRNQLNEFTTFHSQSYFDKGQVTYENKNNKDAKLFFTYSVTLDNLFDNAYYYRGLCNIGLELPREAEADFTSAIKFNPDHDLAFMARGTLLFNEQKYLIAANDFVANTKLKPLHAKGLYMGGKSYFRLKKYKIAVNFYQRAIDIEKEAAFRYDTLYREIGWSFYNLKKHEEAIKMFSKGINLNEKYPLCHHDKGLSLYEIKDFKNAVKEFSKAVSSSEQYEHAYLMRGKSYENLKKWDLAKTDFKTTKTINSRNKEALVGIKQTSIKLEQYADGLLAWEKCMELDDNLNNDSLYCHDLFDLCLNAQRLEKGLNAFSKTERWSKSSSEAFYKKACLYAYCGRADTAVEFMRKINSTESKAYKKRMKKSDYFKPIKKTAVFKKFKKEK